MTPKIITCTACHRNMPHRAKGMCSHCYEKHRLEAKPKQPCHGCGQSRTLRTCGFCLRCYRRKLRGQEVGPTTQEKLAQEHHAMVDVQGYPESWFVRWYAAQTGVEEKTIRNQLRELAAAA